MKKILIITGEASGDLHGAKLVHELKKLVPDLKTFGLGGDKLKEEGMEIVYSIKDIAVVGLLEIIPKFLHIRRAMKLLHQRMIEEKPDICLLIDYPGFNLRFAKMAKKQGIKVVYYILPQVWAWGRRRITSIHRYVDEAISILPFESKFYDIGQTGKQSPLTFRFVGHPLLDMIESSQYCDEAANSKTIALLPGSRKDEVKRILPIMLECASKLSGYEFVIPLAPGIDRDWVQDLVKLTDHVSNPVGAVREPPLQNGETPSGLDNTDHAHPRIKIVENSVHETLRSSKLALIASGTSTLEACILGTPSIIIYRVSTLSYLLAKPFVRIKWIGLPNIIAGEEILPEFVQFRAKPERIVKAVRQMLKARENVIDKLEQAKNRLGSPGATRRTARILCDILISV
jgi:lipid-A-disaccharide synthase